MRRFSTHTLIAGASAALAAILLAAGGKTYSQLSAAALAQPNNTQLAAFGLGTVAGLGSIFLFATGRKDKGDARWRRPDMRPSPRPRPHSSK